MARAPWLKDPILHTSTSSTNVNTTSLDGIPVSSSEEYEVSFEEIVKRVKEFRHIHCGCEPNDDFSAGFLAEMAYCFGFKVEFNLSKKEDKDETIV